jgi:putative restriction endonuclease
MSLTSEEQALLRLAIFAELEQLADARGGFLTTSELLNFEIAGQRIPLIDRARGIRNPTQLDATLAVVSSADGPYNDHVGPDGLLRYAFQARDPLGGDNRKLRVALRTSTPIILFQKPMAGVYVPIIGVYVIDESVWRAYEDRGESPLQKKYVEQLVRRRVHQPVFRARVILAYSQTCGFIGKYVWMGS